MPFDVRFNSATAVLASVVTGVLTASDVEAWRAALEQRTATCADTATFRFLDDLYGYEVADQDLAVHKHMREVTPRFLAAHGFVVGFWQLYAAAPPAPSRAGVCTRVAHVHHDCAKMARYNELLASSGERFFCDRDAALEWLSAVTPLRAE